MMPIILYAVKRQQPLNIMLDHGIGNAQHRGDDAHDEKRDAPPCVLHAQADKDKAQDSVYGRFDHDARHQRGHIARCGGMRGGQPDVQRYHAGLCAETDEEEHEQQVFHSSRDGGCARCEIERMGISVHEQESGQKECRANTRHDEIERAGAPGLLCLRFEHHEEIRHRGHGFPGKEEEYRAARREDQEHREHERGIEEVEQPHRAFAVIVGQVTHGVEGDTEGDDGQAEHKKSG